MTLPTAWENAIQDWSKWLRAAGRSPKTIRTRTGHVAAIARLTHTRHPAEISTNLLVECFAARDYSVEHRRSSRVSLTQFFDHCLQQRLVTHNPASGLPKISEDNPRARPAPDWLWEELVAKAPPRELLMVRLAAEAGLRREEISKVSRDDVTWNGDGYSLIVHGKGGRQRIVPINDGLAEQLQKGRFEWIPPGCPARYVFPSLDRWGNVVAARMSADRVGRLISDLMPEGWSAHKLRHRYATRGFAVTHNLRAVQVALGHASVATTQRYTAVSEPDVRQVAEAVVYQMRPAKTPPKGNG